MEHVGYKIRKLKLSDKMMVKYLTENVLLETAIGGIEIRSQHCTDAL
jgi:hypothetical protein